MKTQEKIRVLRTGQKLSQEQMAEKLEISSQAYSKIESGKTKLSLERIEQIAHILNVDITELISSHDSEVFLLVNEYGTNHGKTIYQNHELAKEIEKLQLIISHKDEIINHLKKENQSLYDMISLLKSNHSS
ncbi:MAG: helix-turn-helix domain-containing protein [Moraxella sp.]|jgi:transcriptional regulator/helix-turn-helix domain-containing protein